MKIEDTLAERNNTHGSFEENAKVVQYFKQCARLTRNYEGLSDSAKEALDNIFQKIGRILTGDPMHIDSWHDITGYATLEEKRLLKLKPICTPEELIEIKKAYNTKGNGNMYAL